MLFENKRQKLILLRSKYKKTCTAFIDDVFQNYATL